MTAMSGVPAYMQVADDLRRQIETEALPKGGQLPSMARLRETYGVSNTVIREAIAELRRDGLVIGQQGKGVFVRESDVGSTTRGSESDAIVRRLDSLARTVQRLDDRMTNLEKTVVARGPSVQNG